MSAPRLESERLLLLRWESEDWIAFKPIATDPAVMRYTSNGEPWPEEKTREFVARQQRHYREVGYCLWKLILKQESRLVGFCGLQPLDDLPGVEVGWWLAQDQWGQGWQPRRPGSRLGTDSSELASLELYLLLSRRIAPRFE